MLTGPEPRPIAIGARSIWLVVAIVVAVVAVAWVLQKAAGACVLCFGAVVFAEGIRPLVDRLERYRVPRGLAILTLYVLGIAAIALIGWFLLAPLVTQAATLIDELPHYATRIEAFADRWQTLVRDNPTAERILRAIPAQTNVLVGRALGFVINAPLAIASVASNILLVLLIAFFWLLASDRLRAFVIDLLPLRGRVTAADTFEDMGRKMGGYTRGVAINMVVIGFLSWLGVTILGVPYTLLLGVIAGLTEAIPIVGPLIGGSVAVVVAFAASGGGKAVQVGVLYLLIQQIEGNTLVPFVMNRVVALHPLAVIVALVVGSELLGVVGAVLAVPAAAVLQVAIVRVFAPLARRASAAVDARSL